MAPIEPYANSNVLPYALFGGYLALTASLMFIAIRTLNDAYKSLPPSAGVRKRRASRAHHVEFYAFLALISLLSTVYYSSHTLALSYRVWAHERDTVPLRILGEKILSLSDAHGLNWGRWLRETDLTGEFFEIAVEKSRRRWWTQQLFTAATPFSIFAVIEGQRRRIPHIWAFVGLAPLISLSFAQALFFLAILWTPVPLSQRKKLRHAVDTRHPVFIGAILVSLGCVALIPFTTGTTTLSVVLSWLFVAYVAPLAVPVVSTYLGSSSSKTNDTHSHSHFVYRLVAVIGLATHLSHLAIALLDVSDPKSYWNRHSSVLHYEASPPSWKQAQSRMAKILNSSTDHPSVTRIALDTILTAIGLFAWTYFRGLRVKEILSSVWLWGELPEHAVQKIDEASTKMAVKLKDKLRKASGSGSTRGRLPSRRQSRGAEAEDDDDNDDRDYVPTTHNEILEGDDDRKESTESAALSWGLSVVGGLCYLTAGTLGAEVAI